MAYVYLHTRLDKNEPFYVGIGEDVPEEKGKYRRAHIKKGRNDFWNKITNKTKYKVSILIDNILYEDALEKEVELIKFYGRADLGLGPLCNLTDGGEGTKGKKLKDEQLEIVRKRAISQRKKVIQKNLDGSVIKVWDSITEAIKYNQKFTSNGIGMCCNKRMLTHAGFIWEFVNKNHITRKGKDSFRAYKKVIQINPENNLAVKVWENADKTESLGFCPGYITDCCKGKYKERYGYKWEYFDEDKEYQFDYEHKIQDNQERKNKRKVVQKDIKTGEMIKIYNSMWDAKNFGFMPSCIYQCVKGRSKHHKGYAWEYLY